MVQPRSTVFVTVGGPFLVSLEVQAVQDIRVRRLGLLESWRLSPEKANPGSGCCLEMRGQYCGGFVLDDEVVFGHGLPETSQGLFVKMVQGGPVRGWLSIHEQ